MLIFFAIEGMKIRRAKTSCGLILMACLNLPYDIHHKPENMYVAGIIPGPHEPSLTELNHYLKPVINNLVVSWTWGVHYSCTALQPTGHTVTISTAQFVNVTTWTPWEELITKGGSFVTSESCKSMWSSGGM